jgi:AcrR family transcriptional regulator
VPRPRSLTDAEVAYAAISIIDRAGAGALTMRAVAAELGMATMSIYRYVASRQQLEELIAAVIFSEVDIDPPSGASWRDRLTALVVRLRDKVKDHPQVVPLGLPHRLTSARGLRLSETVLGILADAGFPPEQRDLANRSLMVYLIGSLQFEHAGQLSAGAMAAMAELPRDEYPMLWASAHESRRLTADEEFDRGLTVVLDGVQNLLTDSRAQRHGGP